MENKDIFVCSRLADERKRLILNQNQVAEYCGVSVKTIGRWEKNIPIPADKLSLLIQLGYDITYILTGVRLSPQIAGQDAAAKVRNAMNANKGNGEEAIGSSTWLSILEELVGGQERLKLIGFALANYVDTKDKPKSDQ